jgi:hypothetical protein
MIKQNKIMEFNFTKEEFEELAQAAPHFETAVKQGTKHNSPKWLDEKVKRIYERIAGPQMINFNCSSCIFYLYQKCGRLWLQDKIKYAAQELEKKKQEEQQRLLEEQQRQNENSESEQVTETEIPEQPTESPEALNEAPQQPETSEVVEVTVETKEEPVEENNIVIKEVDDETWNKLNQFIEEHKDYNIEPNKQPKKRGRKPKNNV